MKKKIIIIGGGAAGMAAGIAALRAGSDVAVLEHGPRPGKKLLSTGNGKCNLTNYAMHKGVYRSSQPGFAETVIGQVSVTETLEFFKGIGILPMDRGGYVYPNSGQASSVLDALKLELCHLGAELRCECEVQEITGNLSVRTSAGDYYADEVILAAGSKAAPSTGSDGSGYEIAGLLGHRIIKPLPALVQLCCRENRYKQLAGVRTEALVMLQIDGAEVCQDRGELQFTDYGISGIPVFQVSRYAARGVDEQKDVMAVMDFMPSMSEAECHRFLLDRRNSLAYRPSEEFLNGMLNKKLALVLLKESGISLKGEAAGITDQQLKALNRSIKSMKTVVTATKSYDQAQVCSGGVDTREINPLTMESLKQRHVYLAGEILDVDGICGGYNLQFAWSSGLLAGRCAGRGSL